MKQAIKILENRIAIINSEMDKTQLIIDKGLSIDMNLINNQ